MVNVVYGDNGDALSEIRRDGTSTALVVMPSTYLIDDKPRVCSRYVIKHARS